MNPPSLELYVRFYRSLDVLLIVALIVCGAIYGVSLARKSGTAVPFVHFSPIPDRVFGVGVLILGLALRIPLLFQSAWYDETFTRRMVEIPIEHFGVALSGDVHPPFAYLIARASAWMFGTSDYWALRIPSLVAGMVTIYLVYRLAILLTQDKRTAQLAAVIMTVLPGALYYSAEARYPALLAAGVLYALVVYVRDEDASDPISFAAWGGLIPMLHSTGLLVTVIFGIMAYMRMVRHAAKGRRTAANFWALALLTIALSMCLVLPLVLAQSGNVASGFWLPGTVPAWHMIDGTILRTAETPASMLVWCIPILLTLFGLRYLHGAARWLFIGVPLLLWIVGVVWHPVYLPRAILSVAWIGVIGWAALIIQSRWRVVWAGLLMLAVANGAWSLYTMDRSELDDFMRDACASADVIYTTSTNMTIMAMGYTDQRVTGWTLGNNTHQALSEESRRAMGFDFTPVDELTGHICAVIQLSYHTTVVELAHIQMLQDRFGAAITSEFTDSSLFRYVALRWTR